MAREAMNAETDQGNRLRISISTPVRGFPSSRGNTVKLTSPDYSTDLMAHAELLRGFFSALFGPRDVVHIYPRLRPDSPLTIRSGLNQDELPTEGRVVSRRPSSTTTKTLARLHELNAQGYDIYFCVNPLIHPRRCQKAVLMARNILIEMDHSDMETQREMLERYKSNIASATYSGSRSLHMIVKMNPPLWNPNRVVRMMVPRLKEGQTSARWPQYVELANRWISRIEMLGHSIDNRAAKDYARLSRVPGFLHAGTGTVSALEHLDAKASWDWRAETEADVEPPEPTDEEVDACFEAREAEVPEHIKERIWGLDVLFPDIVGTARPLTGEMSSPAVSSRSRESNDKPPYQSTSLSRVGHIIKTSTTNVVRNTPQRSFLDDLDDFENLLRTGLPGRGTRMRLHKMAFTAARVFGLSKKRLTAKWRRVIKANPEGTDKELDKAVASLLGDWRANKGFRLYLPDVTKLPTIDQEKTGLLETRLGKMKCPEPRKAARIVTRVVLPVIRKTPRQCIRGTAGINSTMLREAANIRGESRGYRRTWEWMQKARIVVCTNREYSPGIQTRMYRVNIPLVLWLCGYRTEELDWRTARRNFWPALAKLVVVNDSRGRPA